MERYAFDVDRIIPLSGTVFVGSGVIAVGGVVGVEGGSDSFRDRDLNENFCFGTFLALSTAIASDSCLSCYISLENGEVYFLATALVIGGQRGRVGGIRSIQFNQPLLQ